MPRLYNLMGRKRTWTQEKRNPNKSIMSKILPITGTHNIKVASYRGKSPIVLHHSTKFINVIMTASKD